VDARARRPRASPVRARARKRRASRVFAPPAIVRRAFVASARRCARQCGRASVETDRVVSAWKTEKKTLAETTHRDARDRATTARAAPATRSRARKK